MTIEIHLDELYGDTAKLSDLPAYLDQALAWPAKARRWY